MFNKIRDRNIWVIYLATLLLGVAYGIAIAGIGVYLDDQGFTKGDIGLLATAFALGIVLFSIPMGSLIRRFGGKPVLAVSLIFYACAISVFPLIADSFWGVAAVRFLDGAASAGIWISSETILLSRARIDVKAFVMSLYTISISIGYMVGPVISSALNNVAPLSATYYVSGLMAVVAAGVILMGLGPETAAVRAASGHDEPGKPSAGSSALALLWKIKNSCFASFSYGYFQSSVVLFLPIWLTNDKGVAADKTLLITAYFAAGMLLFANVVARLGDRYGHLLVMRCQASIGTVFLATLPLLDQFWLIGSFIFVAGATFATISPISLALQGISVPPRDYARSNSIYNAFYALGMLAGPAISSVFFSRYSGDAMLEHLAVLWGLFVTFTLVFRRDDPHVSHAGPLTTDDEPIQAPVAVG